MAAERAGRAVRIRLIAGLLVVAALAALFLTARESAFFATIEGQTLDWRFRLRGPVRPGPDIVILAIDDRTLEALGPWPLPRDVLADILLAVGRGKARVVAVDLLLGEAVRRAPGAASGADRLPDALSIIGKSAVGLAFTTSERAAAPSLPSEALAANAYRVAHEPGGGAAMPLLRPTGFVAPDDAVLSAAAAGHVNVVLDVDGRLRHTLPVVGYRGAWYPSLPVAATRLWRNVGPNEIAVRLGEDIAIGDLMLPTDARMRQIVDYYGPVGSFTQYSALDALEDRLPAGALSDRLVIVGAAATGIGDVFATPFSPVLPGVEYFATVIDNMLHGRLIRHDSHTAAIDLVVLLFAGALAALVGALLRPAAGVPLIAALAGLFAVGNYFAFARGGLWLNVTFPLAAFVLLALLNAIAHSMQEGRLRRAAETRGTALARYVSPVADYAAAHPGEGPGEAAVLFVDIRGFTARAESMAPAATMALLRDFHREVEAAVRRHHGVIDKFLGDGAMAVFGLERGGAEAARDALACAVDLATRVGAPGGGAEGEPVAIGIGVHYGPVDFGEVGGTERAEVTVGGDTVNVANRLEALTRTYDVAIVTSQATVALARAAGGADLADSFVELPAQEIRGRRGTMTLWAWRAPGGGSG